MEKRAYHTKSKEIIPNQALPNQESGKQVILSQTINSFDKTRRKSNDFQQNLMSDNKIEDPVNNKRPNHSGAGQPKWMTPPGSSEPQQNTFKPQSRKNLLRNKVEVSCIDKVTKNGDKSFLTNRKGVLGVSNRLIIKSV